MKEKKIQGATAYSLGAIAAISSYNLLANLSFALTENVGMSAVAVGAVLLVSRIFDGITDIIAGFIVDKTKTRWGKARPYDLMFAPLWVSVILCFTVPYSLGDFGKIVWVFIMYNMCQSVFYTFITCIEMVRVRRSFIESARVKVITVSFMWVFVNSLAAGIVTPMLISRFGDMPYGWTVISVIFAVPYTICGMLRFFLLKELPDEETLAPKKQKAPLSDMLRALFRNPYAFLVAGLALLLGVDGTLATSTMSYYFKYVYGDVGAASIIGMFAVTVIAVMVFLPKVIGKLGTRKTFLLGFSLITAGGLLKYAAPVNLIWLGLCVSVSSFGTMYANMTRSIALTDAMAYGEWKSRADYEAIYSSVSGMSAKVGMGVSSMILGLILNVGGYDANLAVQPESAVTAIRFLYAGLPAVVGAAGLVLSCFYRLDKTLPGIKRELEERKSAGAETV